MARNRPLRVDIVADMRQRFEDPQPVPGRAGAGTEAQPDPRLRVDLVAEMRRLLAERNQDG